MNRKPSGFKAQKNRARYLLTGLFCCLIMFPVCGMCTRARALGPVQQKFVNRVRLGTKQH